MDRFSATTILPDGLIQGTADDISMQMVRIWGQIKTPLIVPLLRIAIVICLIMSLMLFMERVYMGIVIMFIKLLGRKPEVRYKWEPLKDDTELGHSAYPMILVYKLSIRAVCGLSWPADRFFIQVLDDSTDYTIKQMVEFECQRWARKGINIKYEIRANRTGYKAGALKEGLKHEYAKRCDYVVIFDADFQPESDFLRRTIPFLMHNPELALVQARWIFGSPTQSLVQKMFEKTALEKGMFGLKQYLEVPADKNARMSLDYHFTVEQEVGSCSHAFFGFNGTAGVWRIAAINEAGGWKDRTTVEDMDLSVRASLRGWKFLYLGSAQSSTAVTIGENELPSTLNAFRHQQHRWSCGPANLFRKMFMEIITNKLPYGRKYVIYSFFVVRKIVGHIVTFIFYCVVLPLSVLVPEVEVPKWGAVYVPCIITMLNAVGTPRSVHLLFYWILFENVMSLHRTKATLIGLFEAGTSVNEWIVTEKLGDALKAKATTKAPRKPRFRFGERLHLLELYIGAFLFFCGCYDYAFGRNYYFVYLNSIDYFLRRRNRIHRHHRPQHLKATSGAVGGVNSQEIKGNPIKFYVVTGMIRSKWRQFHGLDPK
ncbi:Glucomannan 4-beta-mannosyltransferase 2 [Hibiscus syriacus]|uniref:Glucomannan 4-beta-mannosyltransferase 2 n=1 Tax=Hibiscus syriacus TaxID=106335 RepID=A0A6A2ZFD0_HIBSY|nr:Glucomannan 4-beta-mannosyltransferase 2 [Hibiscus syriacus]